MANEWFQPTSQYYIRDLGNTWVEDFKYKTLSEELGISVNTGVSATDLLTGWTAAGWQRGFFDDFATTPVGQQPANVRAENLSKVGNTPEQWWAMGRGPTGNGSSIEPGATFADFNTNLYQIRSPSVMGLGAVKLPAVSGVRSSGVIYSTSMQTERRGPGRVIIDDPAVWAAGGANMSYDQSYGFFECSMKCPRYAGSWPGAWMISSDEYTASTYPRVELDINEVYLSGPSEDGNVHITPWLHRPQSSAWVAPGWPQTDKLWSSGGVDTRMYYNQGAGAVKQFDDGFHQFGVLLKKDLTAPNGLGWWIWYLDREEIARIPLITEWLRYYYLIISHQIQNPYASTGYPTPPAPVAGQPPPPPPTYPPMASYDVKWLEVDYWGAWRNPAVVDPPRLVNYVPPVITTPTKTISIARLERMMSVKHDVKVANTILLPEHSSTDTPPVMALQQRFTMIEGDAAGSVVGTVVVTNTPTNPVKYRLIGENADHFSIDAQTGEITTVLDPLVIADYDLYVIATDSPLTPKLPGSNTTKVLINVKEDAIFSFEYYNGPPVLSNLRWWLDAQDDSTYDLDGTAVVEIRDKSGYTRHRYQEDTTKCPIVNPTGIGGLPAWETLNANVLLTGSEIVTPSAISNTTLSGATKRVSVGGGNATADNSWNFTDPCIFLEMWKADPAQATDVVTCLINGSNSVPITAATNKTYTVLIAGVFHADGMNATNIATLWNATSGSLFNQADVPTRWFDGKLGEIGIMLDPTNVGWTLEEAQKIVGGLAHRWNLTSLLPVDHDWKVTAPGLWR